MTIELLTLKDWLLAPIYIALLVLFTKYWADKYYAGSSIKKYILPALGVRIVGCILSALYYQYSYKGGDTFAYYETVTTINQIFCQHPLEALKIIVFPADNFTPIHWEYLKLDISRVPFRYESNAIICRVGGFFSLFAFNSYLCIGLLITYFSFLGCWKLFLVFYDLYPFLKKEMAITTLFIPSVCFWGAAGLQKDTILMASLGYFVYSVYQLFIKKKFNYLSLFQLLVSFILLAIVKIFIAMLLIPLTFIWLFLMYQKNLKSVFQKIVFVFCILSISFSLIYAISKNNQKFNLSSIVNRAFLYQKGNTQRTESANGSGYTLGKIEPTFYGITKTVPKAIVTAMFKPSLLDVKKGTMLFSALENFLLLLFTLFCIVKMAKRKMVETLKILIKPEIIFCLSFALSIFFISGFTAFNLGALMRYRVVGLPFFVVGLLVLSQTTIENFINKNEEKV